MMGNTDLGYADFRDQYGAETDKTGLYKPAKIVLLEARLHHLNVGDTSSEADKILGKIFETRLLMERALRIVRDDSGLGVSREVVSDSDYAQLVTNVNGCQSDASVQTNEHFVESYIAYLISILKDVIIRNLTAEDSQSTSEFKKGEKAAVRLDNETCPLHVYIGQGSEAITDFQRLFENSPRSIDKLQIIGNAGAIDRLNTFFTQVSKKQHVYEIDDLSIYDVDLPPDFITNLTTSGVRVRNLSIVRSKRSLTDKELSLVLDLQLRHLSLVQTVSDDMLEQLFGSDITSLSVKLTESQAANIISRRLKVSEKPKSLVFGSKGAEFDMPSSVAGAKSVRTSDDW